MLGVLEQCMGCKMLQLGAAPLCWEARGPLLLLGLPECYGVLDTDCEQGCAGGSSPHECLWQGDPGAGQGLGTI